MTLLMSGVIIYLFGQGIHVSCICSSEQRPVEIRGSLRMTDLSKRAINRL